MAPETPASRETQEQSIKARKHELFQPEAATGASTGPRKTVKEYLRDTRPVPLAAGAKAGLWVAAALVLLLFLAALLTSGSRPRRRTHRPHTAAMPSRETRLGASDVDRKPSSF
ncbi:MAG: hypothetical protein P4L84_02840 [Isosphaeraceae bacterium]|nr:hypothetical protein [Isosphaeraceae bacterium]